jgi:diguanylate cyclase (GGDEF)-like protein/PAS domain S-box-containing protein
MESETEQSADLELKQAVDNIQNRFLNRVGDRVARGISIRELCEELIIEALNISSARYGCVLRLCETDNQNLRLLELDAVISLDDQGTVSRQHDTLLNRTPDSFINAVISNAKPTFSNHLTQGAPSCLPTCHPPVETFAVLPIRDSGKTTAVLFIANAEQRFDLVVVNRLQSMLDVHARLHITTIVNKGIHNVISNIQHTSRQLTTLMNASLNGIMTIDDDAKVTAFNPACERIFDVPVRQALSSNACKYLPPAVLKPLLEQAHDYQHSMRLRDSRPYRRRNSSAIKANGTEFPVDLVIYHARPDEKVFTTLIIEDISDRVDSARELQDTLMQFKTLTKIAPVGILQLGVDWTCVYANDMWCQLSQLSHEESLDSGWIEAIHSEDVQQTLVDMREALGKEQNYRRELRLQSPDGEITWVSINVTGMVNQFRKLTGSLIVIMDITEKHQAEDRLMQIAHYDALTGLLNRMFFLDRLGEALAGSGRRGNVALLYIDLDGFKAVNDTFGHDCGDQLLKQVATRLKATVREEDTVARLGGDEFTVTLTHLEDETAAGFVAEKIVEQIRSPFMVGEQEVFISASVGIAVGNRENTDSDALVKQADVALYRAKDSGRSRYVYFTPELDKAQRDRSVLITSLRRAIELQAFELHYQPQMLIKDQSLLGFEALLRWPQESGEHINPQEFIHVLEDTGLISDVGQWAISEACKQYMAWREMGLVKPTTTMSVNVSARQLGMSHFTRHVSDILKRHQMPPENLVLEITESTLVKNIESDVIDRIKQLGVQISLDDFGTGYSSLAYLSQLPLDHLKIDRSFISDIGTKNNAVTIVKSIIALARTLGIKVIAEGVEDESVLPMLAAEGCEGYQGYLFSRPLAADRIEELLTRFDAEQTGHYVNFINLGAREEASNVIASDA